MNRLKFAIWPGHHKNFGLDLTDKETGHFEFYCEFDMRKYKKKIQVIHRKHSFSLTKFFCINKFLKFYVDKILQEKLYFISVFCLIHSAPHYHICLKSSSSSFSQK